MFPIRLLAFLVSFSLYVSLAAAAAPPATENSATTPKNLQDLRRQLASSDLTDRQAGQKALDSLTPSDLDALRALAKDESDPEVKARLSGRINALVSYVLTHPKSLSLHVEKATIEKVAAELQRQIGPNFTISASQASNTSYTLDCDNMPFWQIITELNRQSPMAISFGQRSLNLSSSLSRDPGYFLVDTFRVTLELRENPNLFPGPYLRIIVDADPRVGIIQYSYEPHITKITDQNGNPLPPSTSIAFNGDIGAVQPPISHFTIASHFDNIPDIKSIKSFKDFQATIDMAVLEKEMVHTVDLAKPPAPIATTHGIFTINQTISSLTVSFAPPAQSVAKSAALGSNSQPKPTPDEAATTSVAARLVDFAAGRFPPGPLSTIPVRVFDKDHKLIASGMSGMMGGLLASTRGRTGVGVGLKAGEPPPPLTLEVPAGTSPATLEISLPESFRPYTLHIDLHDIPIVPIVTPRSAGQP
jgi:hypothetical protein